MNALGLKRLKVVALAVNDEARATRFYRDTLGLEPAYEGEHQVGFMFAGVIVMFKPTAAGWYAQPSAELNPRITFASDDALRTEQELLARKVMISNRVQAYPDEGFYVGAFLDSEGNRIWFCSPLPADSLSCH